MHALDRRWTFFQPFALFPWIWPPIIFFHANYYGPCSSPHFTPFPILLIFTSSNGHWDYYKLNHDLLQKKIQENPPQIISLFCISLQVCMFPLLSLQVGDFILIYYQFPSLIIWCSFFFMAVHLWASESYTIWEASDRVFRLLSFSNVWRYPIWFRPYNISTDIANYCQIFSRNIWYCHFHMSDIVDFQFHKPSANSNTDSKILNLD